MNYWTSQSIEIANQRDYLDQLFKVYPLSQNLKRELSETTISLLKKYYNQKDNQELINILLSLELFPIKDSYVAYLKRDRTAIERNPKTINRLAGLMYELGFDKMIENCTLPKETNRQIGPMFKAWIDKGYLGIDIARTVDAFADNDNDMILNMSDTEMMNFASAYFEYDRDKGIDFIARVNKKFVIAEAKFLTDYGGHQNAQFSDAISTLQARYNSIDGHPVLPMSILDGVLYISSNNKMFNYLVNNEDKTIVSALLLREYLYSL
ncbi:hypothetical protein MASR2M70_21970 [Bacillota bacterium]